jgi:hypothetical protein
MQCCAVFTIINGFEVVLEARERTADPAETEKYIIQHFPDAKPEELEQLFEQNKQYAPLQSSEKSLPDNTCCEFMARLKSLGEHEKLITDGTTIPDYRGTEYWIKSGRWSKDKISDIGVSIPEGGILDADLTPDQRKEISDEQEGDRIAALTPEQKAAEKQSRLDALADEADRLERRAHIQGNEFDAVAWYNEKTPEVEAKYA